MIKRKYRHGGVLQPFNQQDYEEFLIKKLLEDKPVGCILHHPFKAEWIMKKGEKDGRI